MEIDERLRIDVKDFSQEEIKQLTSIRETIGKFPEWVEFTTIVTENVRNGLLSIEDAMKEINRIEIQEIKKLESGQEVDYVLSFIRIDKQQLEECDDSKDIEE